jgi:hypothetical protein
MSIVWLVRPVKDRDMTDAARFGEICIAMNRHVSPNDIVKQREIFSQDVIPAANGSDFIILAGPTIMVVNFILMWKERFKCANVLVYDSNLRIYKHKTL